MKTERNPSSRRRLAPAWVLAAFGAAMVAAIVYIFPKASLFQQLGRGGDPDRADSVRVLLLRDLLRKGAKGFALQRDYIRQLGLTGDYAGAFGQLERLAADWPGGSRDSLWMLDMQVAFWALAARSQVVPAGWRLRSAADSLLRAGLPAHRAWAAEKAGAVGEHDLAARLYLKVAEADSLPAAWYRRAAEMHAAAGNCRGASQALLAALDRLKAARERRDAFLDALRTLQACGHLVEALAEADRRMGDWRSDTEVLLYLVQLARAADRPGQAQRYAQLLVKPLAVGPEP